MLIQLQQHLAVQKVTRVKHRANESFCTVIVSSGTALEQPN